MAMTQPTQLVVFGLDAQRYALPLASVERSVRAVEVAVLPNAPAVVLGVIDVAGRILPVMNLRRRFGLPERAISPAEHFLLAKANGRNVALVIDEAQGVIECPVAEVVRPTQIVPGLNQIQGVVKLADGLVLIQDLERFLSLEEAGVLTEALDQEVPHEA
jgi:purine-binding chemotaxis protein CheW